MTDPVADLPKVMIVDDRSENLVALEAILQGLPVQIVSVDSGEAALKQLLLQDIALILLDAQMPEMDGFETAQRIRQRERTRNIPIVFLTAVDYDAHLAMQGYASGAIDYITKPIDPWILRAKVSVLVELWEKNRRIRTQAAQTAGYERRMGRAAARVERAIGLLSELPVNPNQSQPVRELLEQAVEDLQV